MDKETTEIAKLTARISRDPRSKLFVPLAEEYKKAGDVEMAIHVLLEGLKNNPEYVTARSSLGKLLLAKGDLAGAQKEFEEVVKTVPDNLMAQKKLGDVFILQDRPLDALSHYKIALSLNPGDGGLASLVSDVEAGRDVRTTIQGSKAKTTAEQAIKREQPASAAAPVSATAAVPPQSLSVEPATPVETPPVSQAVSSAPVTEIAAPVSTTGVVSPQSLSVEPATPVETSPVSQAVSSAPVTEPSQAPLSAMTETEEPEEVLFVEPLEPEASAQEEPSTAGIALPEAQERRAEPSVVAEECFDFDLSAGNQLSDELVANQDIRPETELFNVEAGVTIPTGSSEEIDAGEIFETSPIEAAIETVPQPLSEDISGKSDDFTTDTLAELYISQGFFEKAVEIYERMLVDKPNSRGLQDKLSWVRAAVAGAVTPASEQKKEADIFAPEETSGFVPGAGADEFVVEPMEERPPQQNEEIEGFKPESVTGAGEYVPIIDPEDILIEAEDEAKPSEPGPGKEPEEGDIAVESQEYRPAGYMISVATPAESQEGPKKDFEPREYVPPQMEQEPPEPASHKVPVKHAPGIPGRKETIARLETWLTTIKKEK